MTDSDDNYGKTNCMKCGDCCEPFIMEEELVEQFRSSFQRTILREQHFPSINATLIRTIDNKCVFLFPDNTCSIYQYRPEFPCKMFGIPHYLECPKVTPDGKTRSKEEYEKIIAKNCDRSQWSDEYKKKLDELVKKRVDDVIKKQNKDGFR
jgi:Fe-S-cluster containining protein